jgi:opacity protein-like surface antigen
MSRMGKGGMLRTRLAGRHSAGSIRWPFLMSAGAVALMTGAPSAAHAQCWDAITSPIGTVNTAFLPGGSAFLSPEPNSAPDQQSGGVWTRAVGGTVTEQATTNFSALFNVAQPIGPKSFGSPCHAPVKQNYEGFEAGHDIARLNTGNADWHFGVLAGYVGVKVSSPPDTAVVPSQNATSNAPSAGLYAAYSRGNFTADVQARLYEIQGDSLGQRLDMHGYSLAGNVGYRFELPGNWTLQPSVGGIFSRTAVGPIELSALTFPIPGVPSLATIHGTIQFNDVESLLGRASVQLGTSLPVPGTQVVAYPFVTASVFHEFEGNVTGLMTATGTLPPALGALPFQGTGNLTANGIGTYGQFGGGSAFQLADTGWLGYARFDYRTGENIQGYSVSAGLRYQFEDPGHGAKRASYPVKAPMNAAPTEGYDWSGPYVGLSAGSTWGVTHWAIQGTTANPDNAGGLVGGQAGYNFQNGRFVWGIEGDAGWSNARGTAACVQPLIYSCEDEVGALGSVTGRFGYTWGRALFYGKGGWAFGEVTARRSVNFVDPGVASAPAAVAAAQSTNWENGWTVGVGMEYALTDRWSAKAEYMHYEFPQYAFTVAQGATANATTAGDTVRIGVNYHFGPR